MRRADFAAEKWLRGPDLNRRPSGYEPDELPDCSTPRQDMKAQLEKNTQVPQVSQRLCDKGNHF